MKCFCGLGHQDLETQGSNGVQSEVRVFSVSHRAVSQPYVVERTIPAFGSTEKGVSRCTFSSSASLSTVFSRADEQVPVPSPVYS